MIKRLLISIAFGILIIIFPVAAGVITQVNGIDDIETIYLYKQIIQTNVQEQSLNV